jgi:hypothetical protein
MVKLGYGRRCSRLCWNQQFGSIEERFWAKVDRDTDPDGCWLWIASRDTRNYGMIGALGRVYRAHRVSYELAHGVALTPAQVVLHRCDNPPCVRPDHLSVGTQGDNLADMRAKGRHWLQRNPGDSPHARNRAYRQRLRATPDNLVSGHETEDPRALRTDPEAVVGRYEQIRLL